MDCYLHTFPGYVPSNSNRSRAASSRSRSSKLLDVERKVKEAKLRLSQQEEENRLQEEGESRLAMFDLDKKQVERRIEMDRRREEKNRLDVLVLEQQVLQHQQTEERMGEFDQYDTITSEVEGSACGDFDYSSFGAHHELLGGALFRQISQSDVSVQSTPARP